MFPKRARGEDVLREIEKSEARWIELLTAFIGVMCSWPGWNALRSVPI
jgi:hypothetical protein